MEDRSYKIVPGRGLVTKTAIDLRLKFLKEQDIKTSNIEQTNIPYKTVQNNIESLIGSVEIPVGLIGPLAYNSGKEITEDVFTAIGTLEGALAASMNRGAKAISLSGGFKSKIYHQKMVRAPLFILDSASEAILFSKWINNHFSNIKAIAESYSNHAELLTIDISIDDNNAHTKFVYKTGDAAGQNMTTTCTWHAMLWIVKELENNNNLKINNYVLEGNGASDKKVSHYLLEHGRGVKVEASVFLKEDVIHKILRTSSDQLIKFYGPSRKQALKDKMVGYNINVANAIASIFVATGQDLASIHESSLADLILEKTDNGLKVKLILYSLVIGTIGGGTHVSKQKEVLQLMGCYGEGKINRFASLIAGFALGLELSTYSAMVSGEFAKAHEKLGRNKPTDWLQMQEINTDLISNTIHAYISDEIKLISFKNETLDNGILMNLSQKVNNKLIGFIPIDVQTKNNLKVPILIKSKSLDIELIKGIHILAASINIDLADLFKLNKDNLEYNNSHIKELTIASSLHDNKLNFGPNFYGKLINEDREIHLLFQEYLLADDTELMDSENSPHLWTKSHTKNVIHSIFNIHTYYVKHKTELANLNLNELTVHKSENLYHKMIDIICDDYSNENYQILYTYLKDIQKDNNINGLNKTLIHNDFNPRNVAIRKNGDVFIYDWELAVIDYPQRDVMEFLSFSLTSDFKESELLEYIAYHYNLELENNEKISWENWKKGCVLALKKYLVTRVAFYKTAAVLMKLKFIDRVYSNSIKMINHIEKWD